MSARAQASVAAAVVAVGLVASPAGAASAQFVIYDDFSSGMIDPARWAGLSTEGSFDAPTAQFLRVVDNGSLDLALTSWGSAASDSGSILSRQGLAVFVLEKARGGVNRIGASVNRCPNATCSPGSSVIASLPANPATFATTWTLGQPLVLKLVWNPDVGQFTFTVKNAASQQFEVKSIVYSPDLSDAAQPTLDFKSVRVLNRVENCASGRKRVQMEARFDTVEVMRQP